MTVKDLYKATQAVKNGDNVVLTCGEYHVWSDECEIKDGYHLSNTASKQENPLGSHPVAIFLKDKKDVCIDGNGCKITVHGIITPFLFDGCENLVLKNMTIDYARPTMSEFTILEKTGDGVYKILIANDSLFDVVGSRILWHGERGKNGKYLWSLDYRDYMSISMYKNPHTEFVRIMGRDEGCKFPCVPEFSCITNLGKGMLQITLKNKEDFFPVGCTVQTRNTVRDNLGGAFVNCKNVTLEGVEINAMHGFGILAQLCDTVTFRNLKVTPSNGRTVASNADFFHFSNCCGKITVENCVCSYGHDDFINVHGTHLRILDYSNCLLKVSFVELHSRGFCPFKIGDEINFINKTTLLSYGGTTVTKVTMLNDLEFLLEVTEPCVMPQKGDCIENATMTPEVLIKGNKFGPSMGRGVLCTTRKKIVIEDNLFYKTGGNVLCIEDDCNFWFESGYTADVCFKNNKVCACGYGCFGEQGVPVISVNPQVLADKNDVYVHEKIVVENNEFFQMADESYIVEVKNTKQFCFINNTSDKEFKIESKQVENLQV